MSKKLKIKFWKTERALAVQILEQEGLPKRKHDGRVRILDYPQLYDDEVALRGKASRFDLNVVIKDYFNSNQERDAYLDKITQAITDELFTGIGELKIGEMCEVFDDTPNGLKLKLYAILPSDFNYRFVAGNNDGTVRQFKYARVICKRVYPKVEENGEIVTYTWEEE